MPGGSSHFGTVLSLRITAGRRPTREREMEFKALASKLALILLMSLTLPGCDAFAPSTPPALPTLVLDNGSAAPQASLSGSVTASGSVVPAQEAQLAFTLAGK